MLSYLNIGRMLCLPHLSSCWDQCFYSYCPENWPPLSPFCYYCSILVPDISSLECWPLYWRIFQLLFLLQKVEAMKNVLLWHLFSFTLQMRTHSMPLDLAILWLCTSNSNSSVCNLVVRIHRQAFALHKSLSPSTPASFCCAQRASCTNMYTSGPTNSISFHYSCPCTAHSSF